MAKPFLLASEYYQTVMIQNGYRRITSAEPSPENEVYLALYGKTDSVVTSWDNDSDAGEENGTNLDLWADRAVPGRFTNVVVASGEVWGVLP